MKGFCWGAKAHDLWGGCQRNGLASVRCCRQFQELYLGHWFHVDWKRFVSDILNMQCKTSNSVDAKEMQINSEEHILLSCSLF